MNEELKAKLLQYLEYIEQGVHKGADFVAEQTPLYVQELLAWHFWSYIGDATLFLLPAVVLTVGGRWLWNYGSPERNKASDQRTNAENDFVFGTTLVPCFAYAIAVGLMFGVIGKSFHAAKAKIAPRVIVVEKLQEALRK